MRDFHDHGSQNCGEFALLGAFRELRESAAWGIFGSVRERERQLRRRQLQLIVLSEFDVESYVPYLRAELGAVRLLP